MDATFLHRRRTLGWLASAMGLSALPAVAVVPAKIPMQVWKDPQCGCCQDWIAHMEQAGFAVQVHERGRANQQAVLGVPAEYGSCHTALVDGYVVEGHVPAADVRRLLQQRPRALGIAVPGMPIGSPGMDGPEYGGRKDPYDVVLLTRSGAGQPVQATVFTPYR